MNSSWLSTASPLYRADLRFFLCCIPDLSIFPAEITNYGIFSLFYNIPQQQLWNAVVLADPD
jgi:hypothetical protein